MRIAPLRQGVPIDVVDWAPDAEYAVFPQGARAKEAYLAPPVVSDQVLVPNKRYLFKQSKRSYPDQFWGEVMAYRIGCLLGVVVPPAFHAFNSSTHVSAALIEWFYGGSEVFVQGGDFMLMVRPDYDRTKGTKHNLEDLRILMQALKSKQKFLDNWRQWWIDALLFDALIGNTDRHQDNWGIIFESNGPTDLVGRMSPLFDNGTSLGHERFVERVAGWDHAMVLRYIHRGTHHIKWSLSGDRLDGHFLLLSHAIRTWGGTTLQLAKERLDFDEEELVICLQDLVHLPGPVPLSSGRLNFVIYLLRTRFRLLKNLLDATPSSHS